MKNNRSCIIDGIKFEEDGFHSIWKETRILAGDGIIKETFFVPIEYLTTEEDFKKECQRLYNNFYK